MKLLVDLFFKVKPEYPAQILVPAIKFKRWLKYSATH